MNNTSSKHGFSFLNSFKICRPKKASAMIKSPSHKALDISYPSFPDPPPSTPANITPPPFKTSSEKTTRKKSSSYSTPSLPFKGYDESSSSKFVVVKRSEDPYEDFRKSILEMIVEKQIFEARELEQLFITFISLNSTLHHKVIAQAFTHVLNHVFCG